MHIHSPVDVFTFVGNEFVRFNAPVPEDVILDDICDCVLSMLAKEKARAEYYNYKWKPDNVIVKSRYKKSGLFPDEKDKYLSPLLVRFSGEDVTINQIHLAVWATLIFCWTEEGYFYVQGYQYDQNDDSNVPKDQHQKSNVYQLPMVTTRS